MSKNNNLGNQDALEAVQNRLEEHLKGAKRRKYTRFIVSALGSIPWAGSFFSASAALNAEKDQGQINELHRQWLEEHQEKINNLCRTLSEIIKRIEDFGDEVKDRLESLEYLTLTRKGFRIWDQADTDEKRELVRLLLTNSCATELCTDDLVRLFLDWIQLYHEAHFKRLSENSGGRPLRLNDLVWIPACAGMTDPVSTACSTGPRAGFQTASKVIRQIYRHPGITRGGIWDNISADRPREDSAQADVYRLLIRDLSTGGVIRQHREKDASGQFIKKSTRGRSRSSGVMTSAFEDTEPYELTELGRQFVHYTMDEVTPRIET